MKTPLAIAWLIAAALSGATPAVAGGQTARAGIEAWQKGDYKSAVEIWRPLSDRGDPDAIFNLAQAYRLGKGVPANLATAKRLLERAAAGGHIESQTTLGLLLMQSGDQLDALKWLKSAAEGAEPRALLVFGTALFNGDGVTQDRPLGYAYVHAAAQSGLANAKRTLGQIDQVFPAADRRKALEKHAVKPRPRPAGTAAKAQTPAPAAIRPAAKAQPAAKPASTSGNWRIQLGAFSRQGAAQDLYRKHASALGGRQPFYVAAGAMTRLQIGPYESKGAAEAACRSLAARGQACFAVAVR